MRTDHPEVTAVVSNRVLQGMQSKKYNWDLFEESTCLAREDCQDGNPLVGYTNGEPIYVCLCGEEQIPAVYDSPIAESAMHLLALSDEEWRFEVSYNPVTDMLSVGFEDEALALARWSAADVKHIECGVFDIAHLELMNDNELIVERKNGTLIGFLAAEHGA